MAMTPEQIKEELAKREITYSMLARRAKPNPLSVATIYKNVHQQPGAKSSKARRIIAQAIGRSTDDVFGNTEQLAEAV